MFDFIKLLLSSITMNPAWLASPADSDSPANADDEMRETRSAFQVRLNKEHGAESTDAADGWHRSGSAKIYYQSAVPTTRPDGTTAFTSDDAGRLWIDSDTGYLDYYDGSDWIQAFIGVPDQGGGNALLCKVIDIGDWNMDTTHYVDVAHGLTQGNIRSIDVQIRNDASDSTYPLIGPSIDTSGTVLYANSGSIETLSSNIRLFREVSGRFDKFAYTTTSYNRGWITIWYVSL